MITVGAAFPYLVQSVIILALCFLWVAALLDIRSHMHTRVTSHKVLVFIAIAISVLTVFLIVATDALFTFDNRSEPFSPWSEWGVRLGS
jgi:membrane-associated HD superfamily phosphohydrolase